MTKLQFEVLNVEETSEILENVSLDRTSKYDELIKAIDDLEVGESIRLPKPSDVLNFVSIKQVINRRVKDKEYKIKNKELGNILIILKVEGITTNELPI